MLALLNPRREFLMSDLEQPFDISSRWNGSTLEEVGERTGYNIAQSVRGKPPKPFTSRGRGQA